MDEKERKELIDKILNVDNDPKMARVATTVFINKATEAEARFFVDYLDHSNPAVKKLVRNILSQKAIPEAVDKLVEEFFESVGSLTFMPDAEYQEASYYSNLVEMLETIFAISKSGEFKNDKFFQRIDDIFKRTKSEDLRFSLIKLLGLMGDRLEYFMGIFDDLREKERRGLYYTYTIVEDPRRLELYKRGLTDEGNLDYVITCMLNFTEGREALAADLLTLSNYNKQAVLKKLQHQSYPEFHEVLIKLLSDKNKFLVEMSIDILKNSMTKDMSMEPFIKMVEEGYSPEGIEGSLEIIDHYVKKDPEQIYLNGLEKQPSFKNKNVILEFLIEKLKAKPKDDEAFTQKVVPKLLSFFDVHAKEREELFLSIFKIVASLRYPNSNAVKGIKKKILGFAKEFDKRLPTPFKNNLSEFLVKLNQMIARFEESETKVKQIAMLFDIDHLRIDHARMMKLKDQIVELDFLDESTLGKLVAFLSELAKNSKIDWKVKTVALDLLGEHGGIKALPILLDLAEKDSSLAVKTNAQKAAKKIEERHADEILSVLVMEPLFYLQKMLNEFFKSRAFKVFDFSAIGKFDEIADRDFKYVVVSENLMTPEFTQKLFDYVDEHYESILIIVTAKPDSMASYRELPNVRLLKKPFNQDSLQEVLTTPQGSEA